MTTKVRITSFLTAAVLAFTMGGVKLEKTNDYEEEHVRFSIVATASAEAKDYFLFSHQFYNVAKCQYDEISRASIMYMTLSAWSSVCPEIFDVLTTEERDYINYFNANFFNETSETTMRKMYKDLYPIYIKLFDTYSGYMMTLEPLSNDLTAKNGEDLYSQAKRLYLEAVVLEYPFSGISESKAFGTLHNYVPKLGAILAEMEDPNYDLEANYKTDYKRINEIYGKITSALKSAYKEEKITPKYNKNGAKVVRKTTTYISEDEEIYDDPVDYEAYFPYSAVLDPFDDYSFDYYDREWCELAMIWGGVSFISNGWVDIIAEATGYDPTTPDAEYYWSRVQKCAETYSTGGMQNLERTHKAFHEFTVYFEKYLRMNHLERLELHGENWSQIERPCLAMRMLGEYIVNLIGTYENNPDSRMDVLHAVQRFEGYLGLSVHMSKKDAYDAWGEKCVEAYNLSQQELVKFLKQTLNIYFYEPEHMIPVFEETYE